MRGVCGNKDEGCSSILVSGGNHPDYPCDAEGEDKLVYTATTKNGAHSLSKSFEEKHLIRVFRKQLCKKYCYDGLYEVINIDRVQKDSIDLFVFTLKKRFSKCHSTKQLKLLSIVYTPDSAI